MLKYSMVLSVSFPLLEAVVCQSHGPVVAGYPVIEAIVRGIGWIYAREYERFLTRIAYSHFCINNHTRDTFFKIALV